MASNDLPLGADHFHDDGLAHPHHWARDRAAEFGGYPIVADAVRVQTPSSVHHDDIHFAAS